MKQLSAIFAFLALATGIHNSTPDAFVLAMLENVHLKGNTNGLEISTNGRATISNSVVSGNTQKTTCTVAFNNVAGVNCG